MSGLFKRSPWRKLLAARRQLRVQYAANGVTKVDAIAGFGLSNDIEIWMRTSTDEERDWLRRQRKLEAEVLGVLSANGLPEGKHTVTVQSQETVDRDFGKSWFDAMR